MFDFSSKVVEKYLLDQSTGVQTNAFLHWDKLCRYHSDVVIAILRNNLSNPNGVSRINIWNNWFFLVNTQRVGAGSSTRAKRGTEPRNTIRDELIRNAKAAKKIVELLGQFPPANSKCKFEFSRMYSLFFFLTFHLVSEFPQVFANNLQYFVTYFPKEMFTFFKNSVWNDNDRIFSRK